jgi:hypothetical protein
MDSKNTTTIIILAVICIGVAVVAGFQWVGRAEADRRNAELDARVQEGQKQLEAARATEQSLRTESAQQAQQVTQLQKENQALKNPPIDMPTCVDSDAKYGTDAIYYRGSVRAGSATVTDHCRLGQLVEFSCIENPPGSGRFLSDATILSCPPGSRCVEGECLR